MIRQHCWDGEYLDKIPTENIHDKQIHIHVSYLGKNKEIYLYLSETVILTETQTLIIFNSV